MRALITGISGQDGFFAAQTLVERGIEVVGLSTDAASAREACAALMDDGLHIVGFDYDTPGKFSDVLTDYHPDFVFNFAAKSTGMGMFDDPIVLNRLNSVFPLEILEAIRRSGRKDAVAFVQASSSEMYGDAEQFPQSETTPFRPKSPYGAAKLYVHNMIGVYRRAFGLNASSAILFNHESWRRSDSFVTMKIARAAARIRLGLDDHVELGNTEIKRDWGYAPEYANAMVEIALAGAADDFVLATGQMSSIADVLSIAFGHVGLEYDRFVRTNPAWVRPIESCGHCGDASKIADRLGWRARTSIDQIIREMVDFQLAQHARSSN